MLERISQLVQRKATRRNLLALAIAYCIYFPIFFFAKVPFGITAIQPYASQGGILDVEFFYTSRQAYERLASFGDQGRAAYLHILMGDLVYPALLGSLLAVSICLIVKRFNLHHASWRYLALLPLANMACDYCENSLLLILLLSYPASLPTVGTVAGIATLGKNIFGMLSFAALGFGLLFMLVQHIRTRYA